MGKRGIEGQKERDHYKDQDISGWIVLIRILKEIGWSSVDWIGLIHYRDQWRALVGAVMNLLVT
jgi:hypothetical protein